ncbi:hypothetical protein MHBO_003692 [Bonamia ostreae]|uniref:Hikeshi-like C-terminal domain-containing protein n=1 Tax=Bonamia ostreae TaxID=126728 RepID=A0ABV2AR76_9EUKA
MQIIVLVPGRPIISELVSAGEGKYTVDLQSPNQIAVFTLSVLPNQLPTGYGIGVQYSLDNFQNWDFVGVINDNCPTATCKFFVNNETEFKGDAPWSVVPSNALSSTVRLGFAVLPNQSLKALWERNEKTKHENKIKYAQKIARNLVDYLTSFTNSQNRGVFEVSDSRLENWYQKFCRKLNFDSKFMKE